MPAGSHRRRLTLTSDSPRPYGRSSSPPSSDVSTGSFHLTRVDARTARSLMDPARFGESDVRSKTGAVKQTLQEILLKALGEPDDRQHWKDGYHLHWWGPEGYARSVEVN
jgi:hypothetical protein